MKPSTRPVESLKSRLLRCLLAYPKLAREFAPSLSDLLGPSGETVDRQIHEVLAVATAEATPGELSCAALLEALSESEFCEQYRSLCASELQMDDDADTAREEVRYGLLKIEESRVKTELDALVQEELSETTRERNRALNARLAELKQLQTVASMVSR